jgi:hypothetical protein
MTNPSSGPVKRSSSIFINATVVDGDGLRTDVTKATTWFSSNPQVVNVSQSSLGTWQTVIGVVGTTEIVGTYMGFVRTIVVTVVPG